MPKSPPCVFPRSSLWLASLATLVVQSVLSSSYSSSSSTYQRSTAGGKRQGFMERTLILLDVNTRSPIRVLNDNFLSLQLDPSIIKDGWLDFLRYQRALLFTNNIDVYPCPPLNSLVVLLFITHTATLSLEWASMFLLHSEVHSSTLLKGFIDWQSANLSDNLIRRCWESRIGSEGIHVGLVAVTVHTDCLQTLYKVLSPISVYFTVQHVKFKSH